MRLVDALGREIHEGDRVLYAVGDRSASLRDGIVKKIIVKQVQRQRRQPDGTYQPYLDDEFKVKVEAKGSRYVYDDVARKGAYEPYTYSRSLDYYSRRFVIIPEGMEPEPEEYED